MMFVKLPCPSATDNATMRRESTGQYHQQHYQQPSFSIQRAVQKKSHCYCPPTSSTGSYCTKQATYHKFSNIFFEPGKSAKTLRFISVIRGLVEEELAGHRELMCVTNYFG